MELSKKDKKTARELIEKGLQKEFANGLSEADAILRNWKNNQTDNQAAYQLLYKMIIKFDKHIGRRYDGMTGSNYIFIVAAQLADEVVSKDDLKEFSPEVKAAILLLSRTEG
ncbi:MAG: hypothetical protein ABI723_27370 [Bacteroidia bacterium]